jgi:hypothetical protein
MKDKCIENFSKNSMWKWKSRQVLEWKLRAPPKVCKKKIKWHVRINGAMRGVEKGF